MYLHDNILLYSFIHLCLSLSLMPSDLSAPEGDLVRRRTDLEGDLFFSFNVMVNKKCFAACSLSRCHGTSHQTLVNNYCILLLSNWVFPLSCFLM